MPHPRALSKRQIICAAQPSLSFVDIEKHRYSVVDRLDAVVRGAGEDGAGQQVDQAGELQGVLIASALEEVPLSRATVAGPFIVLSCRDQAPTIPPRDAKASLSAASSIRALIVAAFQSFSSLRCQDGISPYRSTKRPHMG